MDLVPKLHYINSDLRILENFLKSKQITDNVMLGKMIGNDITGVNAEDLPAIKFYTPKGVEPLPTRFLNDDVGGGIQDLRNVIE